MVRCAARQRSAAMSRSDEQALLAVLSSSTFEGRDACTDPRGANARAALVLDPQHLQARALTPRGDFGAGHVAELLWREVPTRVSDSPEALARATPHDDLFKLAFGLPEQAAGLLATLLPPELVERIDLSTLERAPSEYIAFDLQEQRTDLLFRARLGGRETLIYTLLEHQSSAQRDMAFRLLRYMVSIWQRWRDENPGNRRLPVILPIVVSHVEGGWTAARAFEDLFDVDGGLREMLAPYLVRFRYVVDDLALQSSASLHERHALPAFSRLALYLLKRARVSPNLLDELENWRDVLEWAVGAESDRFTTVIMYTLAVAEVTPADWRGFLRERLHKDPDELMGAAEEMFRKYVVPKILRQHEAQARAEGRSEGLSEGRSEGRTEGLSEGRVESLAATVIRRFERSGPVSDDLAARIRALSVSELEAVIDRLMDGAEPAVVLASLK